MLKWAKWFRLYILYVAYNLKHIEKDYCYELGGVRLFWIVLECLILW